MCQRACDISLQANTDFVNAVSNFILTLCFPYPWSSMPFRQRMYKLFLQNIYMYKWDHGSRDEDLLQEEIKDSKGLGLIRPDFTSKCYKVWSRPFFFFNLFAIKSNYTSVFENVFKILIMHMTLPWECQRIAWNFNFFKLFESFHHLPNFKWLFRYCTTTRGLTKSVINQDYSSTDATQVWCLILGWCGHEILIGSSKSCLRIAYLAWIGLCQ